MARLALSAAQARRLALGAQGFTDRRPTGRIDRRHLRRVLVRTGLIQIDSVNVLVRSQELPLFARLGPHPRTLVGDATAAGELFEYWVHEASHVPVDDHHLHRWAMRLPHRWDGVRRMVEERPDFVEAVYRHVAEHGPVTAADVRQGPRGDGSWWNWDAGKVALEALFHAGRIAARRRPHDFARVYDVTERVIPAAVLSRPDVPEREARKQLLERAAGHCGVGTLADLCDYHRQNTVTSRPLVAELVEEGRLLPVTVEGWNRPGYVRPSVTVPRRVAARALLSPFDPVVWHRERVERVFGFHYRIEIYVPKPRRRFGYYVLPFLLGDRLVARVDLKADRAGRSLLVQSAWAEPGVDELHVAHELYQELALMAGWLGLDRVLVVGAGDLSPALGRVAPATPTASRV